MSDQNSLSKIKAPLNVVLELAHDIAGWVILAHGVRATVAVAGVATKVLGTLPDDLSVVASGHLEGWVVRVVLAALSVPSSDSLLHTAVTEGKILTIGTAGVMHNAIGCVGCSVGSELRTPRKGCGAMSCAILVVLVKAGLIMAGRGGGLLRLWLWLRSRILWWHVNNCWLWLWLWSIGGSWSDVSRSRGLWLVSVLDARGWDGTLGDIDGRGNGVVVNFDNGVTFGNTLGWLNWDGSNRGNQGGQWQDEGTHFDGCLRRCNR
jgi:hypothetical protein